MEGIIQALMSIAQNISPFKDNVIGLATLTNAGAIGTTATELPGSSIGISVPAGKRVKIIADLNISRTDAANLCDITLLRDGATIKTTRSISMNSNVAGFSFTFIDTPGVGNYTYSIKINRNSAAGSGTVSNYVSGTWLSQVLFEAVN